MNAGFIYGFRLYVSCHLFFSYLLAVCDKLVFNLHSTHDSPSVVHDLEATYVITALETQRTLCKPIGYCVIDDCACCNNCMGCTRCESCSYYDHNWVCPSRPCGCMQGAPTSAYIKWFKLWYKPFENSAYVSYNFGEVWMYSFVVLVFCIKFSANLLYYLLYCGAALAICRSFATRSSFGPFGTVCK